MIESSAVWIWTTSNRTIEFPNWNPGEPNGDGSENCIHIRSEPAGKWNDQSCNRAYPYICEFGYNDQCIMYEVDMIEHQY